MKTERTLVREIQEEDFTALFKIYRSPNNMRYILTGRSDWTMEQLRKKWKRDQFQPEEQVGFRGVFLQSSGELIGECALLKTQLPTSEELELAYMIDENYWRQGYGTEIAKALIRYGFEDLKVNCLKAGMYKENIRSAKLVQKLGLQPHREGTTKTGIQFQDYAIYRKDYLRDK